MLLRIQGMERVKAHLLKSVLNAPRLLQVSPNYNTDLLQLYS